MARRPNAYAQSLQEAQKRVEEQESKATAEQGNSRATSQQNAITSEPNNGKTAELQNIITAELPKTEGDEEKATEKLTLYLHPSQRDKLDMLIMEYRKQTNKRITHNKLMRMLIEKAELKDLL
jgi:protein subunit release factor A